MLAHLHVKNLALIEEIEVEFGPGLNILTGETGAGKSILLGSMQLILGAKTSKNMIRENASYALVELLFQVENEKALETLKALDICPEDGQVLLSRKIMDGRSINKINGETSTVGQMKAAVYEVSDKSLPNQIYSQNLIKVMQEKIDFFKSNSGINSIDYNASSGQLTIINEKQKIIYQREDPGFDVFKVFE